MQKLEVIDAELARLHATFNHLVDCVAANGGDIVEQLAPIQLNISAIYDMLDDEYERYSLDSMMDPSDDSASD